MSGPGIGSIDPEPVGLITESADAIEPREIQWLWPGRVALGKLLLIAGDPGLGKSLFTLDMAARVSRGATWPVDRTQSATGSVLIVSAEDDAADTIVPRLIAAGADLAKVHILDHVRELAKDGELHDRELSLERDIEAIEKRVAELGDCRLVIVDPISAYLGRIDSHRNSDVRSILAPLSKLAQRLSVAIAAVTHLNKGAGSSAAYRVTGSIAFTAAVRASLLVVKDKDDPLRRLVLPGKNNLGPDNLGGLAYSVEQNPAGKPYLEWEPEPVAVSADEALEDQDHKQGRLDDAKDFLTDELALGPVEVKVLQKSSKAAGFSWRTIERAKKDLGYFAGKRQFTDCWYWSAIPFNDASPPRPPSPPSDQNLAAFDTFGGLRQSPPEDRQPTEPLADFDADTKTAKKAEDRQPANTIEVGGLGGDRPEVTL
jgi:KaiC/GvpD/RAD55 family RecA-like ATPase